MPRRWKLATAVGLPALLLAGVYVLGHDYVRGAAFVVQAAGMHGIARTLAEWESGEVAEQALAVAWRGGELPARRYRPAGTVRRTILLLPGVHASGIDEPRLVGFARDLASMGHAVITVGLPDLARYSITTRTTDMIEDAALWTARQPDLAPDGRIGVMGISFAGGLSIVAAARPALKDRVAMIVSLGGHGDLPRTLRYLCTGQQPDGSPRPPHDYGVVIILLGVADRVVPSEQVNPMRAALMSFLEASRLDMIDKAQSAAEFDRARQLSAALPEPSRTLMAYVNARDVGRLGPILLPHVAELAGDPALSPSRTPAPSGRVYLLHGAGDNVIPAIESALLADELRARGVTVQMLATPLITHAEVDRASAIGDIWRLIQFWSDLLDE